MIYMSLQIDIWDNPGADSFLGSNYARKADEDYTAMRLLAFSWPSFAYNQIAHLGAECLEKIMKAFLFFNTVPPRNIEKHKHFLDKIREHCATFDNFFNDPELIKFSQNYAAEYRNWNAVLRYWMQKNTKGYSLEINKIIKLVDKFYLGSLVHSRVGLFHICTSNVANIFSKRTHFKNSLTHIPEYELNNIENALSTWNEHLNDFIILVDEYFEEIQSNN